MSSVSQLLTCGPLQALLNPAKVRVAASHSLGLKGNANVAVCNGPGQGGTKAIDVSIMFAMGVGHS